jgi:phage-related protein
MRNTFGNLSENIGQSLAPQIKKLLDVITPFLEKAGAWITNHSDLVGKVILVAGAVSGLAVVVGSIGLVIGPLIAGFSAISSLFVFLGGIVPILMSAISVLGTVLSFVAASPIVLIIGALGALIAAIVWSIYHWDLIKETVTKVLNFLDPYIQKVASIISTTIKNWIDGIYNFFNLGFNKVKDVVVSIFDGIKSTIQSVTDWISAKIQPIIDGFIASYNKLSGLVGGAVSSTTSLFSGKKASGGDVYAGNSYLVGENGPEIFTANSTGKIIPNAGGGNIQIVLTGNTFMGREDVAKQIANELADQIKFQLRY